VVDARLGIMDVLDVLVYLTEKLPLYRELGNVEGEEGNEDN
jgi:hypothetical protein